MKKQTEYITLCLDMETFKRLEARAEQEERKPGQLARLILKKVLGTEEEVAIAA